MIFLTIDVGNSSVFFCFFKGSKIINYIKLNKNEINKKMIIKIIGKFQRDYNSLKIIISSVVPSISGLLKIILKDFKFEFFFLSEFKREINIKTKIKNKDSIGDDRIVNIFYAREIYKRSVIIVDFGTATTFDFLDNKGIYSGGVITPGIDLSLQSLKDKTAKLPLVVFKKTKNILGTTTQNAIQSGFFWGYISMVEGLISRIKKEQKTNFKIVLTGGNAHFFSDYIKNITLIDKFFTVKGLNSILTKQLSDDKRF
tara:strand:- start:368 stop:1135 length:768 start_codon:yes stop_codon:yes gene_type:complete